MIIIIFAVIALAVAAAIYAHKMYVHNDAIRRWKDDNWYRGSSERTPEPVFKFPKVALLPAAVAVALVYHHSYRLYGRADHVRTD